MRFSHSDLCTNCYTSTSQPHPHNTYTITFNLIQFTICIHSLSHIFHVAHEQSFGSCKFLYIVFNQLVDSSGKNQDVQQISQLCLCVIDKSPYLYSVLFFCLLACLPQKSTEQMNTQNEIAWISTEHSENVRVRVVLNGIESSRAKPYKYIK